MKTLIGVLWVGLTMAGAAHAQSFGGYNCTVDCSGHEAGYRWAEEHGITDPSDCGGNSNSFIEGCKAYAGESGRDPDSDDDDDDDNE